VKYKNKRTKDEQTIFDRVQEQTEIKKALGYDKQPAASLLPFDGSRHA
jgi:hypothetical protein